MKVEIVTINDESFNIKVQQMGDVFVACNDKCSCVGVCEKAAVDGLADMLESNQRAAKVREELKEEPPVQQGSPAVPLENPKETNSFDWFSGTSWGGSKQSFN